MHPTVRTAIVALAAAAAVGFGAYVLRERAVHRNRLLALERQAAAARAAIAALQRESEIATRALAARERAGRDAAPAGQAAAAAALASTDPAAAWERTIATIRDLLKRQPHWAIPELELIADDEFALLVRGLAVDTDEAQRKALSELRAFAKRKLAPRLQSAAYRYAGEHGGRLPADVRELAPYFKTPVPDGMLDRYAVAATAYPSGFPMTGNWLLYERSPVDERFDTRQLIGAGSLSQITTNPEIYVFARAMAAYTASHAGRRPSQAAELGPHLEAPLDSAVLNRYFANWQTSPADLGIKRLNNGSMHRRPDLAIND